MMEAGFSEFIASASESDTAAADDVFEAIVDLLDDVDATPGVAALGMLFALCHIVSIDGLHAEAHARIDQIAKEAHGLLDFKKPTN